MATVQHMNVQTRDLQERGMERGPLSADRPARPALPSHPLPPPSVSFVSLPCTFRVLPYDFFSPITSQGTSVFVFDNRLPPPTPPTLSQNSFLPSSPLWLVQRTVNDLLLKHLQSRIAKAAPPSPQTPELYLTSSPCGSAMQAENLLGDKVDDPVWSWHHTWNGAYQQAVPEPLPDIDSLHFHTVKEDSRFADTEVARQPLSAESKTSSTTFLEASESTASNSERSCVAVYTRNKGKQEPVLVDMSSVSRVSHMPLSEAAKTLGICPSAMKSACRKLGLPNWPFRGIRKMKRRRLVSSRARAAKRLERLERLEQERKQE
eukprot:1445623-Rhodomonas_salina.1